MTHNDGFSLLDSDETGELFGKSRGPYKKKSRLLVDFESDGFQVLDESQTEDEFRLLTPDEWDSIKVTAGSSRHNSRDVAEKLSNKPICFLDGEGSNVDLPVTMLRKGTDGLIRRVQAQNYSLLGATLQDGTYLHIVGDLNMMQIPTKDCLNFILSLPASHVIVGFYTQYDFEKILADLDVDTMQRLLQTTRCYWKNYRIQYIPNKLFSVSRRKRHRKVGISRTVYDIGGFFQTTFVKALERWHIDVPTDKMDFIERMKLNRSKFGPITDEVKLYNREEGIRGIQLFSRVRDEYTKLGLQLSRPVGAGSIASAMFRKHRLDNYLPTFQSLPTEVMLQAFIGGRFDISRIGFIGNTYQYDINSAYPHIARNLPCLAHSRFEWTESYVRDSYSLWLVRWTDNENRWSPFPYRSDGNHIRYLSSGIGYYYGDEVASGLQIDSDIQILGGYKLIRECEHRPFQWIEDYYEYRQEMLRNGDFGEIIIKLGLNSVYGKLAQTKGRIPRYQNLIWAGMITSGTRAMLLNAINHSPENVIDCATDAVICLQPVPMDIHPSELGAWKTSNLDDLLLLGNGIYYSSTLDKHGIPYSRNRGFSDFDWERTLSDYQNYGFTIATKKEFIGFSGALRDKRLEERGGWLDEEIKLTFEPPKGKEVRDNWIWPGVNETPTIISRPAKIKPDSLRIPGAVVS